ncbi:MAG: hypothetical protein RR740_08895 [Pseudomonas sp.]
MAAAGAGGSFPLSVVISVVDKITSPLKGITSAIGRVGGSLKGLGDRSGFSVLTNAFSKVGSAAKGLGNTVIGIGKAFTGLAASMGLSVGAAYAAAQAYADATGAIGDLAERTGASRERIQELGYAAQLTGSSAEALGGALQKMNITIGNAKGGSKELKEMFKGLDISFKNANGSAKSTDEIFDTVVNRISRIKDPALQAKAAVTIFGKSATELLPLLKGGTKGLAEMSAEARRLGVVIDESGVRAGEEFGDVLDKMKYSFKGVGNVIGTALVPTLSDLATQLTETIVKYLPKIKEFAQEFAKNLPGYIEIAKNKVVELWEKLKPFGDRLMWLSENIGIFKTAAIIFATVVGVQLVTSIVTLAAAFSSLGIAISLTPIGWFLLAGAAIVAVAVMIYKNWDQFASFFTEKFDKVKSAFADGFVKGLWNAWKEFNPVTLIIESINGLVKFITGVDIGGMIKSKVAGLLPGGGGEDDPSATANRPLGPDQNYTAVPEGGPIAAGLASAKAAITVDFKNLPTGASVDTKATTGADVKTNMGYSMMPIQ